LSNDVVGSVTEYLARKKGSETELWYSTLFAVKKKRLTSESLRENVGIGFHPSEKPALATTGLVDVSKWMFQVKLYC